MISKPILSGTHRSVLRATVGGAALALACAAAMPAFAEQAPSGEQRSGFVEGARNVGQAVGLAFHDIGHGAKNVGLEIGHGAKNAGLEIGHGAAKAGREIGQAAKESGKAFARAIRGESREN